ncbi:hypothetical protein ABZZ16_41750, partial [Streptomyces sp. NPDC006386]|uniref:hypothetical protein n=1 Tax=Streptomyces sp. NPDC006386 TaxID=3156762 RepID=UPI00339E272A
MVQQFRAELPRSYLSLARTRAGRPPVPPGVADPPARASRPPPCWLRLAAERALVALPVRPDA